MLTIATVGIYGAWAKVRNRRYIYGNTYLHDASLIIMPIRAPSLSPDCLCRYLYHAECGGRKIFIGCGVAQLAGAGIYRAVVDWPVIRMAFSILLLFYAWLLPVDCF